MMTRISTATASHFLSGPSSPSGHSACLFALFAGLFAEMSANIPLVRAGGCLRA
jgi:hypothetical protein